MSTNTNLPDVSLLEQLANQFFKGSTAAVPPKHDPILHPGNNVDINDPQTSLPDPNLTGGIPKSVAGSGVSPSSYQLPHPKEDIPFYGDQTFDWNIQTFIPTGQLPLSGTDYYFLPGKETPPPFDVNRIKQDFPILQERVNGRPLIWLDNAATTQKPKQVIDRISYFYQHENSNIHRAAHALAAKATDAYEAARSKVQHFLNARSPNEIVFVRGATEGINLVAKSWGEQHLQAGDEIILSHLEHHANIVPWQQLALRKGLKLRVIPVDEDGQLILAEYTKLLNSKTKLVSFTQVSNALGTITPAKQIVELAHQAGAKVLVDGAQSVSHLRSDVQYLNADWFVFSGHKIFGPTGIGVLYGKEELLNQTQPWQGGGNMISDVTFEHTQFHPAPGRFEAGTGNIADAVGLGAALDYVSKLGIDLINQYEHALLLYGTKLLKEVPGLRLIGTAPEKASVLSFVLEGFKTEEVGAALNKEGIAVRSGHHCAQPILRRFGVESTVRPSLAFYNTCADIDTLVATLLRLQSRHRN
ncbi:SufS family cysteine desulfurase [Chitinophaga sp. SYP-B3965]|uniref:family 2A encapsulin nanocompartment cargo protein cysteine desulfurase n=1 Tax=Chitinophaga sp. SYP-B3965 TaxID=2663120 RepID=UPI001299B263|nr:family 2A encapsulin nanocompartment cargo protein cysteine desulfurase [Chitinophaga sp. SYP-B3965]MRG45852.1 SufS family cysteine desulfurase [Chitinophaga sp. SYP-B3965]